FPTRLSRSTRRPGARRASGFFAIGSGSSRDARRSETRRRLQWRGGVARRTKPMDYLESPQRNDEATGMSAAPADADGAAFRFAMREFASGVAIVTCGEGELRAGCTVTALASLSLTPPSLVVCISRAAATLARLRETGAFA